MISDCWGSIKSKKWPTGTFRHTFSDTAMLAVHVEIWFMRHFHLKGSGGKLARQYLLI